MEHVHAVDLHLDLVRLGVAVLDRDDLDIRLAEYDEQVALAGILQVSGHAQVGVHARLEDGAAPDLPNSEACAS